jgi:REP-associated tyrosine transposase
MSRPLRIEYPNAWYHVMNRGRRQEDIFKNKSDYDLFIEIIKETMQLWKLRVAAYCLLPNHYHLLVQTPEANLSRCLRHIDGVYTQKFNRLHNIDGPLFRGRYKSILVEADSYLLPLIKYIHRNPVRAGLAEKPSDYEWSSHRLYLAKGKKEDWIFKDFILSMFSGKKEEASRAYKRFVSSEDEERTLRILDKIKWPPFLGSDNFIERIKEKFHSEKLDDEIPQSKELAPRVELIKKMVTRLYGIEGEELLVSRRGVINEARNIAIYLTRQLRGDSLKQIGAHFGMNKYSSVSSVIERIKRDIALDRKLGNRIKKQMVQIIKSQEQT